MSLSFMSTGSVLAVLLRAWMGASFPPVAVDPQGAGCPSPELLTRALGDARRGEAALGGAAYRVSVAVASAPAHALSVSLQDSEARTVWSRVVEDVGNDCDGAARAIALIVAEEFRVVNWTPPAPTRAGAPPAEMKPAEAKPAAPPPAEAMPARLEPQRARPADVQVHFPAARPLWTLGLGAGFESRASSRANLVLDTRWRVFGPWGVGVTALLPAWSDSTMVGQGRVDLTTWPVSLDVGFEKASRGLFLLLDAETLFTFEQATPSGLGSSGAHWRTVMAAGVSVGGGLAFSERVRLLLKVAGLRTALGHSFTVQGWEGLVLEPPAWQAALSLSLEWMSAS